MLRGADDYLYGGLERVVRYLDGAADLGKRTTYLAHHEVTGDKPDRRVIGVDRERAGGGDLEALEGANFGCCGHGDFTP